ncbi:ribosomal RNA small subunit methyltransferase B [Pedobacter glucosidilyticus]|nr:RNA methyltransferase [Pedobacter glucosidilyticus]KHJ38551.1 ribosomal RNA small subunit methyltransferase B [Pedobacter glucosidilyticus]
MKAIHQLATVEQILARYQQDQPLHRFLAVYYRQNKQMGSKDRKIASRLIYNYLRLGHALQQETLINRLIVAEFLCNTLSNSFIAFYKPEWEVSINLTLEEKLALVKQEFSVFDVLAIFPFHQHLSEGVDTTLFCSKILVQPDLYIRVRKGAEKRFTGTLIDAGLNFQHLGEQTYALANGTKLDHLFTDKGLYEVQDLSSQQVGHYFKPQKWDKWWDCCAASGGKSLLLHQQQPDIKLLVSDIRASILDNLDERFLHAGIRNYQKKVLDLTSDQSLFLHDYEFDGIILDAPCSGSGTWGRTPEMINQFEEHTIQFFQDLQRKIIRNVMAYLKPGKPLIYITCSVFKEENEAQVAWIKEEFKLQVENQELIKGYEHKADTMFVARLVKV